MPVVRFAHRVDPSACRHRCVVLARVFRGLVIAALVAKRRPEMGKYVIGWFLGVPVIVLVIIYLIMN